MEAIGQLISSILEGGPQAIAAILLLMVIFCVFIIKNQYTQLKNKDDLLKIRDERNEKLMERYHDATLTIVEALNNVEKALVEIKAKL